jgi:hypothetical protein
VLPGTGSKTPFLLSKELLKHLGCVLDTENDVVSFKKLKQRIEYRWEEPRRATMLFQSLPEGTNGINTEDRLNLKKLVLLKAQLSFRSAMSRTALTMSPLARQLAESLEFDRTENGFVDKEELDQWSDHETDEPKVPVSGRTKFDVGKYARMTEMTMGKAYVTDKKYVKWVRHNIKTEGSTPGMRKFRLYVELRDQTKSERIHGTMGLGMPGTQMPVPAMPKRMAKNKAAPSVPRAHQGYMPPPSMNHRRPREGEGWGAEMPENPMDMQEWEQITEDPDATDELQGEWIQMISESHHDPTKVNQMNQVLQVMGIRKAVEMFKAIDHFD